MERIKLIATFVNKHNEDEYVCLEFTSKIRDNTNFDAYNSKAKQLFARYQPLLKDNYDLFLVNERLSF